ncbi:MULTISPECIES: helix-turn-helix transcriptional regulator [Streptomyces]|uniref:helix-turn-helix domain-containing protein n=2 Tax=Streptomyces TaxID=1883 RepID=UPI001648EE88|nr:MULTISPECIES: helix-turn-helix transcriptional regulator [Streptomyces]MBT3078350.1 helix-turn-helix domain-containing protein [Streptomyces sp. COG21]MBT3087328.1 helix-turn-helix domain-containing protein [Streptomyces sp. CYG21]MBT3097692.1 helix-turn-helix domain-containing protein [Streptomyces sp. CBG30]MBT3105009.1 helix-turn-helix domain-containing protein [Streptomyces sp. COG19]MDI7790239.1 helix-turn-helix transcriptional regulator [Streptomyces cavourensis]
MDTSLAHRLRATVATLLHETGESQAGLAEAIRVSQAQVSRRQNGAAPWGLDDCDLLAAHFGIDVMDLLAGPSPAFQALQRKRVQKAQEIADC